MDNLPEVFGSWLAMFYVNKIYFYYMPEARHISYKWLIVVFVTSDSFMK